MSEWIVYSKDGKTERCRLKKLSYNGSFMSERTVTATFGNHSEVAFEVFDYITYRGEQFELEAVPTVKKTSRYDYEYELRFVSHKYELERCEMRDIVPNDNGIVYPTPLTFSFTGDVRYLVERIQACLDSLYGSGVWNIVIAEGVKSEEQNITISQQNCWNALSLVNTTYGLNFYIKGRTVTIGGEQSLLSHTFQYGKGNGLYEIERVADTETGIVTKLRAYGGTKNLDYSYPKKPEWSDSVLDTSFVLSPLRLMLPSFKADGKTDYILADDTVLAKYGIREASVIYEDIYPSITGATNDSGQAIDEIKSVEAVDDTKSTFVVHLHDLGFDLEEHLTTADAQISMKSGAMQGYTFNISSIEKQSDNTYKITLGRITTDTSDTDNYNIPNSSWNMAAGDKFVFLNILMPQEYIRDAEERLLERAKEYLAEYAKTNFSYNIGLHDKFLVENSDIYSSLIEGARLSIYDSEIGISEDVTIQSLTIDENMDENILPQVKVTLNNKPSATTLERIQGQIKELSDSASGSFSSQSELLQQYRKKLDKPFFDRLFVAVDADGNELPSTDLNTPISYIKARYHFATVGGVTMFISDNNVDIPTVAEGLPFDQKTIWYNPSTKRIEVLTSTDSGGSEGGVSNFWDLDNIPSWITANKPVYTYSEIKEVPSSLKNPYALIFGSKTYDGSAAKTILASDLGALTAHQTIYKLTFQAGAFSAGSFTANSEAKTINIPTTTSHISEGTNLYFTNARAVNALTSTLANYVNLTGEQTITGKKNFTTGGLFVNGSQIKYDAANKYWKLEGDLLVTGGVTAYGNDSAFTPSTIMDAIVVDNTTLKVVDGVLKFVGSIDGGVASSVAWNDITGKPSWITDTVPYVNISGTKVSLGGSITQAALRTALGLGSNAYSSTAYLPLTGGTITASGVPLMINRTGYTVSAIHFQANSVNVGRIGVGEDNNPKFMKAADGTWHNIWHSGNHGSGSSLDADLLDGMHANKSNTPFGTIPCVKTDGVMEVGHYMDFHYDNTTNSDYSTRIQVTGNYSNTVSLPSNTGTLALTSSNVASATKLQTARTIWGQSFDGTGNINGNLLASIASDDQLRIKVANNLCAGSILAGSTGNFGLYDEINGAWLIYTDGTSVFSSLKDMIQRANLTMQNAKYLQWYQSDNATPMTIMYVNSSNSLVLGKGVAQVGGWTYIDGKVINFRYGTTPTTGMMLNSNGGLTIGPSDLASSSYKLYVDGATRITGNIIFGGEIYKPIPSGGTYKPFRIIQTADYALIQVSSHDGVSANGVLQLAGGLNGSLSQFKVLAGTSYLSGKLGLGVSSPTEKLHVAGNILATGGVTMYSMRSLKNVVDERGLSLEELSIIKPTRYTWKDGRDNKLHIGGIADDVMKVLPEVVYKTEGDVLTMDYGNAAFAIASSLINPIVEHERSIKSLQRRIRELEEEIKRLKSA